MANAPRDRGPRPIDKQSPTGDTNPRVSSEVQIVEGRVLEALPNAMYAVELTNGQRILSRISGDLKTRGLRIVPGDRVTMELSPYDMTRGRITKRQS
jgi:translation initiation factor IF-1